MNQQLTEQESVNCLNALLVGYEFLEILDNVKNTILYKHKMKTIINSLMPELEKHCNNLELLFGVDDATMFNLISDKQKMMKETALLRPEYKIGFFTLLNDYINAPELVLHRNGIKIK